LRRARPEHRLAGGLDALLDGIATSVGTGAAVPGTRLCARPVGDRLSWVRG